MRVFLLSLTVALGKMNDADIDAIILLMLMQAAKDAREDLKAIMAHVKAVEEGKKCMRKDVKCFDLIKKNPELQAADAQAYVETMKNKADSLSEVGQEESLRLQMAMDRMSKFADVTSNMLKKVSETKQGIVANLK